MANRKLRNLHFLQIYGSAKSGKAEPRLGKIGKAETRRRLWKPFGLIDRKIDDRKMGKRSGNYGIYEFTLFTFFMDVLTTEARRHRGGQRRETRWDQAKFAGCPGRSG
jgi:hypothetical protein